MLVLSIHVLVELPVGQTALTALSTLTQPFRCPLLILIVAPFTDANRLNNAVPELPVVLIGVLHNNKRQDVENQRRQNEQNEWIFFW